MTTINLQVSAGTDDCEEDDDTTVTLGSSALYAGHTASGSKDVGLRWRTVNIPNAATITSATLTVYMDDWDGSVSANIRGIDEDDTVTWAAADRPSQRTKTTATITANEANWNNWGIGNWMDIDITSAIQEIVDRGGWAANNDLAVVIENTGAGINAMRFRAYEYIGNAHGAKLDVVYEARTAKLSRSTMNVHPGVMFQTLTGGHGY